jgi:hypothetical protein
VPENLLGGGDDVRVGVDLVRPADHALIFQNARNATGSNRAAVRSCAKVTRPGPARAASASGAGTGTGMPKMARRSPASRSVSMAA